MGLLTFWECQTEEYTERLDRRSPMSKVMVVTRCGFITEDRDEAIRHVEVYPLHRVVGSHGDVFPEVQKREVVQHG